MFSSWRRVAVRRRVVVNLKSGETVTGILWSKRGELLEVRRASLVDPAGNSTGADGSIIVERRNVAFVQILKG